MGSFCGENNRRHPYHGYVVGLNPVKLCHYTDKKGVQEPLPEKSLPGGAQSRKIDTCKSRLLSPCAISWDGNGFLREKTRDCERERNDAAVTRDVSELRTQKATGRAILKNSVCLGYQAHGFQGIQSLTEQAALVMKRNVLLHSGTKPEELAYFITCST